MLDSQDLAKPYPPKSPDWVSAISLAVAQDTWTGYGSVCTPHGAG